MIGRRCGVSGKEFGMEGGATGMTSVMRLIKRFVITLILSLMVLLVLNIVLIIAALQNDKESLGGWKTASKLTETLTMGLDGEYQLSEEGKRMLEEGD